MKRTILNPAFLLAMALSASLSVDGEGLLKGLVAYWNFDETSGASIEDQSGQSHHGILRGAARVPGKLGSAIQCGQDALAEVPHSAGLDEFSQGITVSAWVKRDEDSTWNMVVSREIKDGTSEYFGLAVVKNKALFSVDPDGAHYLNVKSDEDVSPGQWVHLAGTYDNKTFNLYINGRLAKSSPCAIPFRFQDKNPLIIGGNTNTEGKKWVDCFHGQIDEVQLFNRALGAEEVSQLAR